MKNWWRRRTLKLRLALWYAATTAVVLAVFIYFVFETVEHRLRAELDRQLRIDFDLVEAQLVANGDSLNWPVQGAHGNEGFARLFAWFEVWSDSGQLLLRRWPVSEETIRQPLPSPKETTLVFYTAEMEGDLYVRIMERPARLTQGGVVIRLFRDESEMRHALEQIVEVSAMVLPLAVLLASLGGYLIAGRSFAPVASMAARARKITSQSLKDRLPNPNPHDELGQLAAVFNETLGRLENSFDELKRFTADASHELRTPLTALRTVGEVALRAPDGTPHLREAIGSMLEEAERLRDLTDSLLTLARMESSLAPVACEPVPLCDVTADVKASLDVLGAEKRQTIELASDGSPAVPADRSLLRHALLNVVHNAIRYSPTDTKIVIRVSTTSQEAVIAVEDRGPGIAPEHQAKIFDRFFRVDPSRARVDGGYGLGLAIARHAMERQGGRIEVQSAPGQGTIFRLSLPLT